MQEALDDPKVKNYYGWEDKIFAEKGDLGASFREKNVLDVDGFILWSIRKMVPLNVLKQNWWQKGTPKYMG